MPPSSARISTPLAPDDKKREPKADAQKSMSLPSTIAEAPDALGERAGPASLEALGHSRGGLTSKLPLLVDGRGRPLALHLTAGQVQESTQVQAVLDRVRVPRLGRGRPRKRPKSVLTDQAYLGKRCRGAFRSRRISALIPTPKKQRHARLKKGSDGGRPYLFDAQRYKQRNVVERCINRLKQFRRIATRYDKRAESYLAFITFASILIWLRS
jgi:transposase